MLKDIQIRPVRGLRIISFSKFESDLLMFHHLEAKVDESTSLASAASMMACTGQHHLLVAP